MSCWYLGEKYIAVMSECLARALKVQPYVEMGVLKEGTIEDIINGKRIINVTALYRKLHKMNYDAYCGRYTNGKEELKDITPEPLELPKGVSYPSMDVFDGTTVNKAYFEFLKMLHCFHYQCAEDPVYDSQIFKDFETIISGLESHVILQNQDYKNAEWGGIPKAFSA